MALQATHDADIDTLTSAAASADWQIRRLAATQLNLAEPSQQSIGQQLDRDESFQVRYEVLSALYRRAGQTGICAPLAAHLKDPSPIVVLRTMDLLVKACTDLDEAVATMTEWADELRKTEEAINWLRSSHALTSLARLRPDVAKSHMAAAVKHPAWQVRAAAATATVALADEAAAVDLADDSEPNVRTAALQALSRMQSTALNAAAIKALKTGADYQLLRTAAIELKSVSEEVRDEATEALLGALRRLTDEESDTSRDTRIAILDRLAAVMRPERSTDLIPFASDYDSHVVAAARKAFVTLVGAPPADATARWRYPHQPTLEALANLPTEATIRVDGGSVVLKFVPEVAPVTIARFAELASAGFYNNSTFFRAAPNFIVQGGSPGANDYSATSRFMREEVGPQARHVRGAVAMSTRGGDTGDGQIFIDLVDLPRFDRDYTVFAYVIQGMEFIDRLLEGAKIVNISVK
jgi:cyclophilin family peptidyl-prolyl cis-trans isomerase